MSCLISASRIITCNYDKLIENGFIEIENDKIMRIGQVSELTPDERNTCNNYPGCAILPGLINAHEHLVTKSRFTPWTLDEIKAESVPMQTLRAAKNAEGLLREGITTIRECGSRDHINLNISRAVKRGFIKGPDVLACGRPISITGGHCYYYSWQVNSPADVVKAVRTELLAGVDFIKVHATGGAGTLEGDPNFTELTLEELTAAVQESHRAGKRVVSHAIGRGGIENSLKAGVDSLEHGHYLDDELLELMVKNSTYYVPTLTGYVPLAERGLQMGRPTWMVEKAKRLVEKHREAVALTRKYPEIVIAAGTDSSGEMTEELELFVENGFTPEEAIIFATRNAAAVLGLSESVGTIAVGKRANILIVKDNPYIKVSALRNVIEVIKGGQPVKNQLILKK